MTFHSAKEMTDAVNPAATVLTDRVSVTDAGAITGELVDRLAWTAVFGGDAELRGTARWIIRNLAASRGIRPSSIHELYMAMGRGEAGGFTVPAINVRAMAYDTARAVIRAAKALNAGAFIFEIARSEIGYTEQRPHEYAAIVLAAALREGFRGPIFIQGDHVQTNAKKYNSPERDKEIDTLRALIKEAIAAGSPNADGSVRTDVKIDLHTLEELSRLARDEYGLAGAVQHGASTLPPDAFDAFPRVGACEIHLATDFQNMVYEHPQFPPDLKAEMYAWVRENAVEERKPKDTEEQFIYKARKKAIGPFKKRMWSISEQGRRAIGQSLEERFTFLMQQLKIDGTADVASRFVPAPQMAIDRDGEIVAAGGKITAAEKK